MQLDQNKRATPQPLIEALEPRILFSADIFGGAIDNPADDPLANLLDETAAALAQQHTQQLRGEANPYDSEPGEEQAPLAAPLAEKTLRLELVFIDTDVPDYQQILDDLLAARDEGRRLEIILLDNGRDGVEQITEALQQHQGVDAIHLISHGDEATVDLGNVQLSQQNLAGYQAQLRAWGQFLADEADILIYGCNLAATAEGQTLIDRLARLTDSDIAASDDLTGNRLQGGDWELEYRAGSIETALALSAELQQQWTGLLAMVAGNDSASTSEDSELNVPAPGVLANDSSSKPGHVLDFDAGQDDNTADNNWKDLNGTNGQNWQLRPGATHTNTPTTALPGITGAFQFNGSGATTSHYQNLSGDITQSSASIELWAKPNTLSGQQVLFEAGGTNGGPNGGGTVIYLDGPTLNLYVEHQGTSAQVSVNLGSLGLDNPPGDFLQVVAVVDLAADRIELFVNGASVGSAAYTANDWAGNGANALGTVNGNAAGGFSGDFNGDVAKFRVYQSALTAGEVTGNYQAVASPPPQVTAVNGSVPAVGNQITLTSGALVTVNADGSYSYNPNGRFDYLAAGETATDSFTYRVTDDSGASDTATVTITINGVNDAPQVSTTGTPLSYTENDSATAIDPALSLADVDSANLSGATVTLSGNYASGEDLLAFTNQNGISGSWNASTGTLTLSGVSSLANYEAALRSITYFNNSDDPSTATRTVTFVVNDGAADSSAATRAIAITAVNDAPTSTPVTLAPIAEDSGARLITQAQLLANASDPDGPALTASGLAISSGAGSLVDNGDGTWSYTPAADDDSAVSFSYSINDGSLSTTGSASLDITPVNDGPLPAPPILSPQSPPPEPETDGSSAPKSVPAKPAEAAPADPLPAGNPLPDGTSGLSPIDDLVLAPILKDAVGPADQGQARSYGHAELKEPTLTPKSIDLLNLDLSPLAAQTLQSLLMKAAIDNPAFIQALDEMQRELDQLAEAQTQKTQIKTEAMVGVTMSLTAGFISWILRTGTLMASFLAASPLWRQFDPLPILGNGAPTDGGNDAQSNAVKEYDKAEKLFESQTRTSQDRIEK
jgi:VCBS repeat-containing protein